MPEGSLADLKAQYEALFAEYQDHMHRRAWSIAWGFFFVLVGLLPMMYLFVWMVGPGNWERTFLHAPKLMFLGAALNLSFVVIMLLRLYRKNLELDAQKQDYLKRLKALKTRLPREEKAPFSAPAHPAWNDSQDEFKN